MQTSKVGLYSFSLFYENWALAALMGTLFALIDEKAQIE